MLICLTAYAGYLKAAKQGVVNSYTSLASGVSNRINRASQLPADTEDKPDFGKSSIIASTTSPVTMHLVRDNHGLTGCNERALQYMSAGPGKYNMVVDGAPGTAYKIHMLECDYHGKQKNSMFAGVIPGKGRVKLIFEHATAVVYSKQHSKAKN